MTNQTKTTQAPAGAKTEKRGRGRPRRMARPPEGSVEASAQTEASAAAAGAPTARGNKTSKVIMLITRPDGATLSELIAATGWLPHTTRAALTGLRKRGHTVERFKREDATCYRIVGAAQ